MQYIWASRERHLILCTTSAIHPSPQAGFPPHTPAKTVKLGSRFRRSRRRMPAGTSSATCSGATEWMNCVRTSSIFSTVRPSLIWRTSCGSTRTPAAFAPSVGQELERLGVATRTLDRDARFKTLAGFCDYDVSRPRWLNEQFGIILFDPPFFNAAPVSRFVEAVRILARYAPSRSC